MNPKYISIFLCCFIFGIGLGSLMIIPATVFVSVLFAGLVGFILLIFFRTDFGVILIVIFLGVGIGYWYIDRTFVGNEYASVLGKEINVEGVVAEDPVNGKGSTGKGQQLTLLPDGYTQNLRAQLYTPIPDVVKGDRVWIRGQVELPENFSEFDYIGYLQRYEVYAVLKKPKVIVLHRAQLSWRTPLLFTRQYISSRAKIFPEKEGSLIVGMLIGQKQNIPEDISNAFKTTGLTHIVAVSGFNMTIIATAVGTLVWYFGRRATNILTLFVTFGFVVVTGATAAVVRAAVMAVLVVFAQLLGRQYASLYALLIVCSIMVLQNPRIVIWDIGFQLSAAATFGVLIAYRIRSQTGQSELDLANANLQTSHQTSFLGETLRPTLGAIFFTAPIIAIHFQTFSVIAPIANLVVLPFVSWIMLFGALSLIPVFGEVFVLPAKLLTSLIIFTAEKFSKVPYASVNLDLPIWFWGLYYLFAFWFVYIVENRQLPKVKFDDKI